MDLKDLTLWTQIAANIAQALAFPLAIVGLFMAIRQLRQSAGASKAVAWLEVRRMFLEPSLDQVHRALRSGAWQNSESIDWASLDAYMGLFEHLKIMLDDGLIDWPTFRKIYAYRVQNVMKHRTIVERKLAAGTKESWDDFRALVIRLQKSAYPMENFDLISPSPRP